jgi:hypothetical protein
MLFHKTPEIAQKARALAVISALLAVLILMAPASAEAAPLTGVTINGVVDIDDSVGVFDGTPISMPADPFGFTSNGIITLVTAADAGPPAIPALPANRANVITIGADMNYSVAGGGRLETAPSVYRGVASGNEVYVLSGVTIGSAGAGRVAGGLSFVAADSVLTNP